MGEAAEPVDLLVIGGGPGGYTAALRAAALGRAVTLVERGPVGGVCLNVGCIPSKMLIDTAGAVDTASRLTGVPGEPDLRTWQGERAKVVGDLGAGITELLRRAGVRTVSGSARFTGRNRVAVTRPDAAATFLQFRHAVIATGSRPQGPAGLGGPGLLDSTATLALDEVPRALVVLGAGYIGIELATAFAKLGSEVTVLEVRDRILPGLPAMLAGPVARRLTELGVTVHTGAKAVDVTERHVRFEVGRRPHTAAAEKVLVATGRRPNTDNLGLEAARVPVDPAGLIAVGIDMRVPGTDIAAIGDVVAGPALAHKATAEAEVAAEALSGRPAAFDPVAVPVVVFSDPEIASAGHTVESARAAGMRATATTVPSTAIGRAVALNARHGFTQVVVDTDRDVIVGVHLAGPHASELIAEGVLALEMAASPGDLAATVHPHPTLSEGLHLAAAHARQPP